MKSIQLFLCLVVLIFLAASCNFRKPTPWNGPQLTQARNQLTVTQLQRDGVPALLDMSFFAKPDWAKKPLHPFSGALVLNEASMQFPLERAPYPGERIFPKFSVDFITYQDALIPLQKALISTRSQSKSLWDVIVGTGKVWQEANDGDWTRASFPLSLTDRYIGQVRNCVATFVYTPDSISQVCIQCSQETADLNDHQLGNIRAMVTAKYQPDAYSDADSIVQQHLQDKKNALSVLPLHNLDTLQNITNYFEKSLHTNASTSLGAVYLNNQLYVHPPKTRHGLYPYPKEMHHGVYSVSKSMVGALSLSYFAQRYGEEILKSSITDYVPALANHPGWQGVTFAHTLNMLTGTEGSERAEHLYEVIIKPSTAEEAIQNIARLGDDPAAPGEQFKYMSTNLFVLSYALQKYVEEQEGEKVYYWDLVREHVLKPLGIPHFSVLHSQENDGSKGIPMAAYGARPTLDEAAKIALLFAQEGNYQGKQLLHKRMIREALGRSNAPGYSTGNDFRGAAYHHSFWSTTIHTRGCALQVSYMLGFGANHVLFLPKGTFVIRFMDEFDMDIRPLVQGVAQINTVCEETE